MIKLCFGMVVAWLSSSSATAQESDAVASVDPGELNALRGARDRFRLRMEELEADTRAYVDLREAEEREAVLSGFDVQIQSLEDTQRDQRYRTIDSFEAFLREYPAAPYASHVRFRLADLRFEEATESWQQDAESYFAKLDDPNLSIEELEALGEQPLRDLSRSLDLYQRIISDNRYKPKEERYERLDGTYVMLGFVYSDPNNKQYDEAAAIGAFRDLLDAVPESELADRSHLFLGNFAFADNRFDEAIASYKAVYDKGNDSKYYMEGLYQLAWARYKLNAFDDALALFTELLDQSHQDWLDSGRESAFAPDARRFMAFSFADLGYDLDRDSVDIATEYFTNAGPRPYEREVIRELADVLERYTRPEEAIAAYELLQTDGRWKLESDNPEHQIALIKLYQTSVARDLEQAGEARLTFIDMYGEGTEWWKANQNDPEALAVARNYLEGSLLDVAIEYRVRAQDSGAPEDFALAAAKYREYLDRFPISDDYYEQLWFLADSLKLAGSFDEALEEMDALVRSEKHHIYGDAARYAIMESRYQQMLAMGHEPDAEPADAAVARTDGEGDKAIEVMSLSADRMAFIEAADEVVGHDFSDEVRPSLPDYAAEVEAKRPSLMYLPAQILYYHRELADARARFEQLIAKYPRSIEANYAAGLLVDSYLMEGNLEQVRAYTLRFTVNPPGPTTDIDPERFRGTLEGTTFQLAMAQADQGDHVGAAEAFLTFLDEFPESEFRVDALYNAAFYYQQAGKVASSNELYEKFVEVHADDARSKSLLFRIAANYEAAFELEKAEAFYDRILGRDDASEAEKADAQYNRSFLLIGLGRHDEAAKGFEDYEAKFEGQEDRETVLWLAGEQWEKVGDRQAQAFYKRYLRKYPAEQPDHAVEAQYRLLKLLESQGARPRVVAKQRDAILKTFDELVANGAEVGANGHRYAAAADFPRLAALFEDYGDEALTGNETGDAKLLNETKPAELKAFEAEARAFVGRFKSFEHNAAALLLQARAALYLADLGLSIKCPPSLSEEDCWLYEDVLQDKVFPQYYEIEEVGLKRLQDLVAAAKQRKRYAPAIDEALIELNRRRPAEFPAAKRELAGKVDAAMPAAPKPLQMSTSEEL